MTKLKDWLEKLLPRRRTKEAAVDFKALAESSVDVVLLITPDHRLRYVSPSITEILGWQPEELINGETRVHKDDLHLVDKAVETLLTGNPSAHATIRIFARDGSLHWMEGYSRFVRNENGNSDDIVVILRDVTERKRLEEQLEQMALTDELTGLGNRRAFDEALEREWQRTVREGSQLSLLLLDIDHFKALNDQYGHQVGDDCLRAIAASIRAFSVRPDDIASRYGGEEITIILPGTDGAKACEIAERTRRTVEGLRLQNPGNEEGNGWVTVSIGVATAIARVGGSIAMPQGLLLGADSALYRAKNEGRNRISSTMLLVSHAGDRSRDAGEDIAGETAEAKPAVRLHRRTG